MAEIAAKKVSELTVDELKSLIHETISEDIEAWRETLEIMADRKLMRKIKKADDDWQKGKEEAYSPWNEVKNEI
ncbi:MAG: hypothetical protein HY578_03075 [Nitrospinae bacterium]|nr:hypothetical protein [Nitrospinota bacterium]